MLALTVSGCGFGAVSIEPHTAEAGSEETCTALLKDLPEVVSDAVRRDVAPEAALATAWGQPPIVLRCGVSMPSAYRPDTQLIDVGGVGWFAEEGDGGVFFTATDREVLVEVAVPDDYAPAGFVLDDISPTVASHIPERGLR
nr:DUF3515 domain-containing protein [Phytoactinopolyspora mesophila]